MTYAVYMCQKKKNNDDKNNEISIAFDYLPKLLTN